jgi:hypothetical protein
MTAGLSVNDVVNVSVTLSPTATTTRNFGAFLIIGASVGLASTENLRVYSTLTGVGNDFATSTPEYLAAQAFYSQSPQPSTLYIGRWNFDTASETLPACINRLAAANGDWYGCTLATTPLQSDSTLMSAASQIEGMSPARVFFYTANEAAMIVASSTTDLAYTAKAANLTRTALQFTTALVPGTTLYSAASLFGRIATVNWNGSGTAITLKFQQEPGVTAETLTETQAATLDGKNCNYFVNYQNGSAILQQGVMSSGVYIDTRIGVDWLQNALQVAGFNALYGAQTKIPQTDAGMGVLAAAYENVMDQAVTNGLSAAGTWTGPSFGPIVTGQTLTKGYAVYMPPIATQSAAARGARQAVVAQIGMKLAGAVHSSSVLVNVVN